MYTNILSFSLLDMWIKATEEGLMRAEAVKGVLEELQKQLENLKVGHILCQLLPQLIIVWCPDPTHKGRGSGYTSLISWASGSAEAL